MFPEMTSLHEADAAPVCLTMITSYLRFEHLNTQVQPSSGVSDGAITFPDRWLLLAQATINYNLFRVDCWQDRVDKSWQFSRTPVRVVALAGRAGNSRHRRQLWPI